MKDSGLRVWDGRLHVCDSGLARLYVCSVRGAVGFLDQMQALRLREWA